jgi:hypothetical protein
MLIFFFQAAVPYTLPLDNPNGTMIWETNQKEATADFYKNGMKFYNGYLNASNSIETSFVFWSLT